MDFLTALFILLGSSVIAGEIASRLGHVALVGQVAVGIILGPTLLGNYLGFSMQDPALGPPLSAIQTIAVFFILFMAGLEVVPEDMWNTGALSAVLGVTVFVVPFLLGSWVVPLAFAGQGLDPVTGLFIALTLSITALPVMAVILIELGLLKTPLGSTVMAAAVVNELAAMTTFAILLQFQKGNQSGFSLAIAGTEVALFLATVLTVHQMLKLLRQGTMWASLQRRLSRPLRKRQVWFALLMIMALSSSLLSQALGLTFLVGAFYAGLLVTRESAGPVARREIGRVFGTMTWGFFIPLFFAFVGLNMDLRLLLNPTYGLIFLALLLFACLSKIAVGFFVPLGFHWPVRRAAVMASLVNGRGAVELAIATILLGMGVFTIQIFTLVAAVGLVTSILAPLGASLARQGESVPRPRVAPASPERTRAAGGK